MAINTSNRMITSGLTKLEKKDYATQIDLTDYTSLFTEGLSALEGYLGKLSDLSNFSASDILNNYGISIKDHDYSYESMSQFGNPFCSDYPSLNVRLPTYNYNLDRNLDFTFTMEICGRTKTINPVDYLMKASSFVNENKGLFSSDANTRLRALLSSDLVQKMNIAGLGSAIPDCILEKTGGYLSSVGSNYSDSGNISLRRKLNELLSKSNCSRIIANQVGVYSFLSSASNSHFLNMMINGDLTRAETYFSAILGANMDIGRVFGSQDVYYRERISFMTGYSRSFTESYAYNDTYNKLSLLHTSKENGEITDADKVYLSVSGSDVLDSLNNDETANKDIGVIEKTLDFISPDWNKDELGNTNLYKTNGNTVLAELAGNRLTTLEPELDLDGVYETVLTTDHHIAIINSFAVAS